MSSPIIAKFSSEYDDAELQEEDEGDTAIIRLSALLFSARSLIKSFAYFYNRKFFT